jgi:hypothetical protein
VIRWIAFIAFVVQWIRFDFWAGFWSYAVIVAACDLIGWALTLLVLGIGGGVAGLAALFGERRIGR